MQEATSAHTSSETSGEAGGPAANEAPEPGDGFQASDIPRAWGVTRVGPGTQELRLATVMTGGVSLAIWMGGVTRELNLLQQAACWRETLKTGPVPAVDEATDAAGKVRTLYLRLLNLLDVTVSVDTLSGTSAGGINAALLGLAHANRLDLGPLRNIWLKAGAFDTLLRDPTKKDPPSLLQGDGVLLAELATGIGELRGSPSPVPAPNIDPDRGKRAPQTRVFITTTLLSGETSRFTDAYGTLVQDTDHRGLFEFDETDLVLPGVDAALALAARSSASFPAAFEPAFLPHDKPYDQDDDPYDQNVAAQGRTLKRPAMKKYANITRPHWVADGGLLANRPINPLLQAIFDRPAERQVRRVLLYVVPSPGDAPDPRATPPTESPKAPLTMGEALLKDFGAVLNQAIAADLRALRDHNDRVDSVRDTRRRMAELGLRLREGERLLSEPVLVDYRSRQAAWLVRPVIAALMRALTTMPADDMPEPWRGALAPGGSAERDCRNAAAAAVAGKWPSLPEAVRQYDTLAQFGRPAFDGAKATVLAMLRAAFVLVTSQQQEQQEQQEQQKQQKQREQLASAGERVHAAFTPVARPDVEDLVATEIAASRSEPQSTLDEVAATIAVRYADALAKPDARSANQALSPGEDPSLAAGWRRLAAVLADHADLLRSLADADAAPPTGAGTSGRDTLQQRQHRAAAELKTYLQFLGSDADLIAVRLFDLHAAVRSVLPVAAEVEQPIELVQVSADTRSVLDPDRATAQTKLTGVQLHHFGAFYKSSWRANDWAWGRLDGAGWLVHLLLDPRRVLTIVEESPDAKPDRRAEWFYGQLRHRLLDGEAPAGQPVGTAADGTPLLLTETAVKDEFAYLDDPQKPIPASLPLTALWVALAWQRWIAATELPVVAREILSTPSRYSSAWATEVLDLAGSTARATAAAQAAVAAVTTGQWSAQQRKLIDLEAKGEAADAGPPDPGKLAAKLKDCPVPGETFPKEVGEPLFTRTVTKAAAVATAAATGGKEPPSALRPVFATSRSVTLTGYRASVVTGGRARGLIVGGAVVLGIGILLATQRATLVGLSGVVLALVGAYLLALGAWSLSLRLLSALAAFTAVGLLLLPATPVVRRWLFGTGACKDTQCPDHDIGIIGRDALPWLRQPWWHVLVLLAGFLLLVVLLGGVPRKAWQTRQRAKA